MVWKRKKNYRTRFVKKRYKSKKYLKRTGRKVRAVKNLTAKVPGLKGRFKRGTETKFTFSNFNGGFVFDNTPSYIWSNNGAWAGVNNITIPGANIGESGFVGTELNALYADVRFVVRGTQDNTILSDFYRIAVIKSRFGTAQNLPLLPTGTYWHTTPIDTKQVHVYYDKVFTWMTGRFPAAAGYQSVASPSRLFRFVIPLKMTVELVGGQLRFPQFVSIVFWCAQNFVYIPAITCKFYYKDP